MCRLTKHVLQWETKSFPGIHCAHVRPGFSYLVITDGDEKFHAQTVTGLRRQRMNFLNDPPIAESIEQAQDRCQMHHYISQGLLPQEAFLEVNAESIHPESKP